MDYDVKTADEYLAMLEDDWRREVLLAIRKLILADVEPIKETIQYKMLCYVDQKSDRVLFHLNAQKTYVSLYAGDIEKIDPEGELLRGLDCGKCCVRIKKRSLLQETRIGDFIENVKEMVRQGEEIPC